MNILTHFWFTVLRIKNFFFLFQNRLVRKLWFSHYTWHDWKICKFSATVTFFEL